MIYDYECSKCNNIQEEVHGALERPYVHCNKCLELCIKLICGEPQFCGVDGTASMYNFTDFNTTGQPVVINSKTQWRNHLKKHGLNDDVQNSPYTKSQLETKVRQREGDKQANRREIKKVAVEAYKKRGSTEFKQRVKESIRKEK